jgi:hypothetical protein
VIILLEQRVDIAAALPNVNIPLQIAAVEGHIGIVQIPLANCANVN